MEDNSFNLDRKLLLERNRLADDHPELNYRKVRLYKEIRPEPSKEFSAGSYLYFDKDIMKSMYQQGIEAAEKWMENGLKEDLL